MRMIIGRSLTPFNSSRTKRGVRRRDDNSRGQVQNVRGDSSAHRTILPTSRTRAKNARALWNSIRHGQARCSGGPSEVSCHRAGDWLAGLRFVEAEAGAGIHLEAHPFTLRGSAQIDAGEGQAEVRSDGYAPGRDSLFEVEGAQVGGPSLARCIPIVGRVADNLGSKDLLIDHVYANVGARDVRLELRRAPADALQPIEIGWTQHSHDRSNPARRLVDDVTMLCLELENAVGIVRDDRLGDAESVPGDELRLIRFRTIRAHGHCGVHDPCRRESDQSADRVVQGTALRLLGRAVRQGDRLRQLPVVHEPRIHAANLFERQRDSPHSQLAA